MPKKLQKLPKKITILIGSNSSIVFHTVFFVGIFVLRFFNVSFSDILLILTTLVSLEAIYLSIFIQISVNQHLTELKNVSESVVEIEENIEGIQKDVEEIQENVEEIQNE